MNDRKLYYVCLFLSIFSILALSIYSYTMEPEKVDIGDIKMSDVGEEVEISGVVRDAYSSGGGHFFFHVKDETGEISSVIFEDDFNEMGLKPGQLNSGERVKIVGEVDIHNRNIQILPEKIIL